MSKIIWWKGGMVKGNEKILFRGRMQTVRSLLFHTYWGCQRIYTPLMHAAAFQPIDTLASGAPITYAKRQLILVDALSPSKITPSPV
jgi:hypothetical protein